VAPHTGIIFYVFASVGVLMFIAALVAQMMTPSDAPAAAGEAPANAAPGEAASGSGGHDQAFVEKELTNSPESLDEDIYGMGIAAIIRDSQRFAMKTEAFSLRASRLSITLLVLLFTMSLQLFLMYEMKHLVTSVSTNEARDTYDKYEIAMYGNDIPAMTVTENGYHRGVPDKFNIANFDKLDDDLKDAACQMPLSQPAFFVAVILIWTLVCAADMRRVCCLGGALVLYTPTIDSMEKSCEETPEDGDEAVIVVGLTLPVKIIIVVFVLIPRLIVSAVLLWLGCRWLCGTMGFSDVLQNAVTLEFVLLLKDIFYQAMAPHHNKIETRNTFIQPNQDKRSPNAPAFIGAFAWGLMSIAWVLLYVEALQQVLPEYNWDIHTACSGYLAAVEGKTP